MLTELMKEYQELTKASLLVGLTAQELNRAKDIEQQIQKLQKINCPLVSKKAA